ncbi:MAG: Na+/H+ antiporter NhaA [Planctomycetes bacterium]|nr:Na+/H+ antiporter NhaA [Planctomycetota bacterium]
MHAPTDERLSPLARMVRSEAFPGILLVACAALAIVMANSPWAAAWEHFWHTSIALSFGDQTIAKSAAHWISDGLMVLFFFFVGLEIKHEVLDGHLQSFRQAALPVAAAIGGMAVPAGIYAATIHWHDAPSAAAGWGIPMATDIAFALGVLALLGRRVPVALKVFLASLAVADDLGAVLVIAIFYTDEIAWQYLGFGGLVLLASVVSNRLGVRKTWPYVVYGLVLWATFLQSGVHATIAGVALALTIPARRQLDESEFTIRGRALLAEFDRIADPDPLTSPGQLALVRRLQQHAQDVQAPLQRMVQGLHPLVAHFIVPVFALANAGVDVSRGFDEAATQPAAHGVFLGLLLGKPIGILVATWLCVKLLRAPLPAGVGWGHVHGVAWIAGIGFTMSLFIDSLAFADQPTNFEASKVAILVASALAGCIGFAILRTTPALATESVPTVKEN